MNDTFRKEYRTLDRETKDLILSIKINAEELWNEFDKALSRTDVDCRCMALAKTKLEEAVMWAVKAIT